MKLKKIIMSLLSALFFVFFAIAIGSCFNNESSNSIDNYENYTTGLRFTLLENGEEYMVSVGTATDSNIVIPSTYKRKPVTIIEDYGFADSNLIESVVIPNSIEIIGESAFFSCSSLENVSFGNNVKRICENAFFECSFLEEIVIPNSVERIGQYAFYGCNSLSKITLPFIGAKLNGTTNTHFGYIFGAEDYGLNSYYVPSNLSQVIVTNSKVINTYDFFECTSITYIALLNNISIINNSAFNGCFSLETIILSDSILNIEYNAFFRCSSIASIYYEGTYEQYLSLQIYDNQLGQPHIKRYFKSNEIENKHEHKWGNPKVIEDSTCSSYGHSYITCILCETYYVEFIPLKEHTEVIDQAIAATCTKTGLTQGSHCSTCNKILVKQNVVPITKHTEVIDKAVAATCTKTGLTQGSHCVTCDTILVKQNVVPMTKHTEVMDEAVVATCTKTGLTEGSHCSTCNEILVKQNVVPMIKHTEVIDEAVEATCTKTGLTQGSHCSICNKILVKQNVVAAKGHTKVVDKAIAATCTKTGLTQGSHCSTCNEVLITQQIQSALGHNYVNYVCKICDFHYFTEGLCFELLDGEYKVSEYIGSEIEVIVPAVYNGKPVTIIGESAFENCRSITSIVIPYGIKIIEEFAFSVCSSLTKLTLPNSVTVINRFAFEFCNFLKSIVIPSSVTRIGGWAFQGCNNLQYIYFKGSIFEWQNILDSNATTDAKIIYNYVG